MRYGLDTLACATALPCNQYAARDKNVNLKSFLRRHGNTIILTQAMLKRQSRDLFSAIYGYAEAFQKLSVTATVFLD